MSASDSVHTLIVSSRSLEFLINNTVVDYVSKDNGQDVLARCAHKQVSLQALTCLSNACILRLHEIISAEQLESLRGCFALLLRSDKTNCELPALHAITGVCSFAFKTRISMSTEYLSRVDRFIIKCEKTLFLLRISSWEDYPHEATLLKQMHRCLSCFVEEMLRLFLNIALFATHTSHLLLETKIVQQFSLIRRSYAKLCQGKTGVAESVRDEVAECERLLHELAR